MPFLVSAPKSLSSVQLASMAVRYVDDGSSNDVIRVTGVVRVTFARSIQTSLVESEVIGGEVGRTDELRIGHTLG